MKKRMSPALSERAVDRYEETSRHNEHKSNRSKAFKYRAFARAHSNESIPSIAQQLINQWLTVKELANLLNLSESDIESLLKGNVYPYVRNAWISIMNEPDDFSQYKLGEADRSLTNDEKWELFRKNKK